MQTIGIDLGGTQIKCGLVEDGRVLHACRCDTRKEEGYDAVVARMAALAGQFLPRAAVQAVGVATPGLIDVTGGVVSYSNNFGWENRPLALDLGDRLGLPVQLANDAQCAALGEARHGAGQGCARMAMVTIGTGVGGGFVRNGRIETDGYGSLAYIFGHAVIERNGAPCNCGRRGCLEAYASATAVAARGTRAYGIPLSAREVFERARAGEPAACAVVEEFLACLTAGVVDIANILRPQLIVVGGGVSASADMILPALNEGLAQGVYGYAYAPVRAVCAWLGNQAGVVGAASLSLAVEQ